MVLAHRLSLACRLQRLKTLTKTALLITSTSIVMMMVLPIISKPSLRMVILRQAARAQISLTSTKMVLMIIMIRAMEA